jgi:pimeloyl-ACP methyl ester carboxylesterase
VLLHGFTSSSSLGWERTGWTDLLTASGFRVVTLDVRSHGDSDRVYTASACATPTLASDVAALLDHLDLPRASVFGFSMGGGIALQLAIDHPGRVPRLVVGGVGDAAINGLHDAAEVGAIADAFEADAPRDDSTTPWRLRRIAEAAGNDLRALLPFLRGGGWPGGLAELRAPAVPLLLLVAGRDQYMRTTTELRRRLPQAEVLEVPRRDHHDVLLDAGARARVVDFLREPQTNFG